MITGGSRGIGYETAKWFYSKGYHVYVIVRDIREASRNAPEIRNNIFNAIEADLALRMTNLSNFKSVDREIDVLINNAAEVDWTPNQSSVGAMEITHEELLNIFSTNVIAPITLTQALLHDQKLKRRGGRIVNVVSGVGEFNHPDARKDFQIGYASSKSALIMATMKMAAALEPYGISVNAACPGWCNTRMGGKDAPDSPKRGAESIVKACFLDSKNAPTGGYYRHGERIL